LDTQPKSDIAVLGLAVMGQNLILNMNDHGFRAALAFCDSYRCARLPANLL
jgi:6-phosphogluconate dehydrogenase